MNRREKFKYYGYAIVGLAILVVNTIFTWHHDTTTGSDAIWYALGVALMLYSDTARVDRLERLERERSLK